MTREADAEGGLEESEVVTIGEGSAESLGQILQGWARLITEVKPPKDCPYDIPQIYWQALARELTQAELLLPQQRFADVLTNICTGPVNVPRAQIALIMEMVRNARRMGLELPPLPKLGPEMEQYMLEEGYRLRREEEKTTKRSREEEYLYLKRVERGL